MIQFAIFKRHCSFILLVFILVISASGAMAGNMITDQMIKDFYHQAAQIQMAEPEEAVTFYEKHLHENSISMVSMISNAEGAPTQKQRLQYDKKTLIEQTKSGYEFGRVQSIENTVLSIDIAGDGLSARVKDTTYAIIDMSFPTPDGIVPMRSENSVLCDDLVVFDQGVLKIKESVCSLEMNLTRK